MFIKKPFSNSEGDTIVEVLLSITILSLILTISYSLTNRDSQYIQQSQERSEAQNISEQQLELLRNYLQPDTDWNASHYICFDNANPPQPTSDDNQCYKGIQDAGRGRYHTVLSYDDSTHTYTVETTWASLTNTTQQNLDLSYKLPVSALTPVGLVPACRNNFDDDGDGLKDINDPGCHPSDYNASNPSSYNPNYSTEVEPPPPPPPPVVVTWSANGSGYSFCAPDRTLILPIGDGYDGCQRSGTYMYAWRNFNAVYSSIPSGFQVGNATLKVCYQNYSTNAPPAYGGYQLKVTPGHGPTQLITLPTASPTSQSCGQYSINIDQANFSTLRMVWFNDSWSGGDANLRINTIQISQDTSSDPQKPNKAIAGRNYTSCQISSNPGYCILSDELYNTSVYALSTDTSSSSNTFKTTYKFNGLSAGNYDLGVSYFNGDVSNLPAPPGYSYTVNISYPGGSRTVHLPIENNLTSRHLRDYVLSGLDITSANPTITLEWMNDSWNPGVWDANFGINSVLLKGN